MKQPELPSDWRCVPLASIADVQTGLALGKTQPVDPIRLPYLRVANVQDGYLDLREIKVVVVERSQVARYSLQHGDVLMTEGGDFDKLGRGHIWHGEIPVCLHQNHVFVVRPHSDLLSYFLASVTSSDYGRAYFLSCSKQSTNLASINSSQLKAFPVPLPPFREQEAITLRLSIWDRGIRQLSDLIAAKVRFKQGLMQQLLTGQRRFKRSRGELNEVRLGDCVRFISGGTPSRDNALYWNGTTPWYSAKDLKSFYLRDSIEHITEEGASHGTRIVEPGTLLLLVRGMTLLKAFPVGITSNRSAFNQDLRAVLPKASLLAEYLGYWFLTHQDKMLSLVDLAGHGTGRLSTDRLVDLCISVPERLEDQRAIVKCLRSFDQEIDLLRKQLTVLKQQKKGLMQKLLTGEVRVTLPREQSC